MSEQTKNKIFWAVLILMIVYAVGATYVRVFVNMDYLIMNEVSCDPTNESCFVYNPEEACAESENPNCAQETESWIYKIIYKKAANIPFCEYNPEAGEGCPELTCVGGETKEECYYEYCEEGCAEKIDSEVENVVEESEEE